MIMTLLCYALRSPFKIRFKIKNAKSTTTTSHALYITLETLQTLRNPTPREQLKTQSATSFQKALANKAERVRT